MEEDQENHVKLTRSSSKKRAAVITHPSLPQLSSSKKRVVLGEITNSSEIRSIQNPKLKSKTEKDPSSGIKLTRYLKEKSKQEPIKRIDEGINGDLEKCDFSSSMYEYLHSLEIEEKRRLSPNYMEKVQNDITVNMREVLIGWLVEVTEEYKLVTDTLYLTVSYIDRFLSSHSISRNKLQLLGVTCMLVASKYEEISPPHVDDFCYMTDNSYSKEEVVKMEKDLLKFFNFDLATPTVRHFLRILMRVSQEKCRYQLLQVEFLSFYLAELTLLDYECVQFLPSSVASAAIFLSRFITRPEIHPWTKALECYSGYRPADLKECVLAIHALHLNQRGNKLGAVKEKYSLPKFKSVAKLSSPFEVPGRYFEAPDAC